MDLIDRQEDDLVKDSGGLVKDLVNDCISRQAAIERLKKHRKVFCKNHMEFTILSDKDKARVDEIDNAIATLVNLPSAQPETNCSEIPNNSDTIYRQAAIDALEKVAELYPWRVPGDRDSYSQYNEAWQDALNRADSEIEALPPAKLEITHCAECIHWKHSDVRENYCEVFDWMNTADDFCSFAERRSDE